jgi:hypothetical protein
MTPLPIDERRIAKLAQACDLIEEERPHGPFWKLRTAKPMLSSAAPATWLAPTRAAPAMPPHDHRHPLPSPSAT